MHIVLDHVNYVGEDDRFGAVAISYKREKTEIPLNGEEDAIISQYEYRVIIRTSEVCSMSHIRISLYFLNSCADFT